MASQLIPSPPPVFTAEQVELIKRTIAKGATHDELQLFLGQCKRTGLDPFARQIYAIRRYDSREKREVMQTQASIDGFRLIADRTGKYEGQVGPYWCGRDGKWVDVWVPNEPPVAARVGVLKSGCREPFWSVAKYSEYVQFDRDGNPNTMWRKMPANQLAKCSEGLSLRKAFPQELSGLYTSDEMDHVDTDPSPAATPPSAEPEAPRLWKNYKGMLDAFAELRGRLADDNTYHEILAEFGVTHSNQFRKLYGGSGEAAYYKLLARVEEKETADAEAEHEEPEATEVNGKP